MLRNGPLQRPLQLGGGEPPLRVLLVLPVPQILAPPAPVAASQVDQVGHHHKKGKQMNEKKPTWLLARRRPSPDRIRADGPLNVVPFTERRRTRS